MIRRHLFCITLFFFLFLTQSVIAQETVTGSFVFDGQERDYRLRIPPASAETQALVFNLHGYTSNAWQQEGYSQMNTVADTAGFFVCYPDGLGNAWNVGWAFGSTADDVGFISALIDTLVANHNIDPDRVYSCGMSNGGFMSYRLACELNDKIAAVASVTGSMVPAYMGDCNPGRSVPVLEIHGTSDETVPYDGQPFLAISMEDLLTFWRSNNGCDGDPIVEEWPNSNLNDGSTVTMIQSTGCNTRGEVLHYRVNNGGHTWPGSPLNIGVTNQDINASAEIWRFFNQYTINDVTAVAEPAALPLTLYPNPAGDRVFIQLPKAGGALSMYDFSGRELFKQQLTDGQSELEVSALPRGIYFVQVVQEGTIYSGRLMLQ